MDKETLSNYGWIVICVLVLAVMIALATPFGNFIADAVKSTTAGFFSVNQNALNSAGVPGLTIPGQEFEDDNTTNESSGYKYYDMVEQGDYRYFYLGCNDYEDFCYAYLKMMLYDEGIMCTTNEEALEQTAQLMAGCSWADLEAQGITTAMLFEELGLTEELYNSPETQERFQRGWLVVAIDKTQKEYDPIPEQVDGIPVTSMDSAFANCTSMTTAPEIPSNVTSLYNTFYGCSSLTTAPEIPNGVTDMYQTFRICSSLTTAPIIPSSVTNVLSTFYGCTSLKGTIELPCSIKTNYQYSKCPATIVYYHVDGCDGSCGR